MDKNCLYCGDQLIGRTDKKFCNDQCRNNFNNQLNSDSSALVRRINNTLRKNRRILSDLNPSGKTSVHKEKLINQGFNFNYYTHTYTTQKGTIYRFVYEYGYLQLDNDFYILVVQENKKVAL